MTHRKKASTKRRVLKPRKRTVSTSIDATVLADAEKILADRGTTIKLWLTLQISALTRVGKAVVGLEDKMPLGKYFGAKVEDVIRGDPSYAKWLLSEEGLANRFHCDVHQLYQELAQ